MVPRSHLCIVYCLRLLGYLVDHIDSLVDEWYPGLTCIDPLLGHELLQKFVPCTTCTGEWSIVHSLTHYWYPAPHLQVSEVLSTLSLTIGTLHHMYRSVKCCPLSSTIGTLHYIYRSVKCCPLSHPLLVPCTTCTGQ